MAQVIFAEFHLSDNPTPRRSALAGFDVTFNGNVYPSDGMIVDVGQSARVLSFENVPQEVSLSLIDKNGNDDVQVAFRENTYRWREATIWKGITDDTTGMLLSQEVLKKGPMEAMNDLNDDGTITLIVSSDIVRSQRTPENVALQAIHNDRLSKGVYGGPGDAVDNTNTTDLIFENANKTFDEVRFGQFTRVQGKTRKSKFLGITIARTRDPDKPKRSGAVVSADDDDFQPAKPYGGAKVDAKIINAWNPSLNSVYLNYNNGFNGQDIGTTPRGFREFILSTGGSIGSFLTTSIPSNTRWYGDRYPDDLDGIVEGTRFVQIQYAVAVGNVDYIGMEFTGLNYTGDDTEHNAGFQRPTDPNEVSVGHILGDTPDGRTIAGLIEVQWSSNTQVPLAGSIGTSSGLITSDHRGIGHVIVTCLYEAGRSGGIFSGGFPNPTFYVENRKTRDWDDTGYSFPTVNDLGSQSFTTGDFDTGTTGDYTLGFNQGVNFVDTTGIVNWRHSGNRLRLWVTDAVRDAILLQYDIGPTSFDYGYVRTIEDPRGGVMEMSGAGSDKSIAAIISIRRTDVPNEPNRFDFMLASMGSLGRFGEDSGMYDASVDHTFRITYLGGQLPLTISDDLTVDISFPAVFVDYLTNGTSGAGLADETIDLQSFQNARGAARTPGVANGVMQGRDSYLSYVEDLQASSGLTIYEERGLIKCYYTKPYGPNDISFEFDEMNTETIKQLATRNRDRYNRFELDYNELVNETQKNLSLESNSVLAINSDYLEEDLLQDNRGDMDAPFLTIFHIQNGDAVEAATVENSASVREYAEYAGFVLDKSRFSDQVEVVTTYDEALGMNLGDPFTVNKELYGWTGLNERVFEAIEITDNHDNTVTIVGAQHTNEWFGIEDSYPSLIYENTPPVLSRYTDVVEAPPPSSPTINPTTFDEDDRSVELTWLAADNAVEYIVEWRLLTEPDAGFKVIERTSGLTSLHRPGRTAATYIYRVISINQFGIQSSPSAQLSVNVAQAIIGAEGVVVDFSPTAFSFRGLAGAYEPTTLTTVMDVRVGGIVGTRLADNTPNSGLGLSQWTVIGTPQVVNGSFTISQNAFSANNLSFSVSNLTQPGQVSVTFRYNASGVVTEFERLINVQVTEDGIAGQGGISYELTNPTHNFSTLNDGVVADFTESAGAFSVILAGVNITNQCTYSSPTQSGGLTVTIDAFTGTYVATGLTADNGTATFVATVPAALLTDTTTDLLLVAIFTVTKSRDGAVGTAADVVRVIRLLQIASDASVPGAPTGGINTATGVAQNSAPWTTSLTSVVQDGERAYEAVATITQTEGVGAFALSGVWSVSQLSGNPGVIGQSILVVYADDAIGTNQSLTAGTREFVQYHPYNGVAPTPPVTGSFVKFIGGDGNPGGSVLVVYADDAIGTNQSVTADAREFINYHEYTGTAPTPPITATFVRFVGGDGAPGQGIFPIYADENGNNQSFTEDASREFVNFFEAAVAPTLPVAGLTFVRYVGEPGSRGSGNFTVVRAGALLTSLTDAAFIAFAETPSNVLPGDTLQYFSTTATPGAVYFSRGDTANSWTIVAKPVDGTQIKDDTVTSDQLDVAEVQTAVVTADAVSGVSTYVETLTIYFQGAQPAIPAGTSVVFDNEGAFTFTTPTNWLDIIPSTTDEIWVTQAEVVITGAGTVTANWVIVSLFRAATVTAVTLAQTGGPILAAYGTDTDFTASYVPSSQNIVVTSTPAGGGTVETATYNLSILNGTYATRIASSTEIVETDTGNNFTFGPIPSFAQTLFIKRWLYEITHTSSGGTLTIEIQAAAPAGGGLPP